VIYEGIASALSHVFLYSIPFAALVFVLALFIRHVKLRGSADMAPAAAEPALDGHSGEPVLALAD
jgi:hypothetical protein